MGVEDGKEGKRGPTWFILKRVRAADCKLQPLDRWLAVVLAEYAGLNPSGEAWPSVSTLARDTGLSCSRVKEGLAALCAGPLPLFAKSWAPSIENNRKTPTFTVVKEPAAYAAAREAGRIAATSTCEADQVAAIRPGASEVAAVRPGVAALRPPTGRHAATGGAHYGYKYGIEYPIENTSEHTRARSRAKDGTEPTNGTGDPDSGLKAAIVELAHDAGPRRTPTDFFGNARDATRNIRALMAKRSARDGGGL